MRASSRRSPRRWKRLWGRHDAGRIGEDDMTESDEIRRTPQRRGTPRAKGHDARGHRGGRITGAVSRPWLLPALFGVLALAAWEAAVRLRGVPDYVLPG